MDAALQPRRDIDARQMGIPVVGGVGPGVPHDSPGAHRWPIRQGTAPAAPPRVVYAPERAAAGLRIRIRRREPPGARLGGVARL